jgi:hypothetical protein
MAGPGHLRASDCDLPPANEYPGKWYRQNPSGSVDCDSKAEWVANEARQWYEYMKNNPKYDETPIWQKAYCLKFHLRRLKLANSEVRKLLVNIEMSENDTDSEEPEIDATIGPNATENMDTEEARSLGTEDVRGSQRDMFAESDDEP